VNETAPPPLPEFRAQPPELPSRIPVTGTVRRAWDVLLSKPRQTVLPMAVIQVPVALVTSVATVVLYLTTFKDEPVLTINEMVDTDARGQLFAFLVISAVTGLFSQVARAATTVGVANAAAGKSIALSAALDPAFTRMGALLGLAILIASGAFVLVLTLVGLVLLPFLALKVALSTETLILEDNGPWGAIRRSWALTGGHLLSLLGVFAVTLAILVGPLIVVSLVGLIVGGGRTEQLVLAGVATFGQTVLLVPLFSFLTAVITLFYLQAKERERA